MVVKISKNRIDVAAGQVQNAELATCSYTTVVADSGSAYTINLSAGNSFYIKLTANCTFTFSNPPASGKTGTFELILKQDMTGGRTVSWPKSVLWPAKTAPTLTTTAQGGDILRFHTSDGGTTWFGAASASVFDMASTLSPLFVWGSNSWGELGLGDAANRSAPVQLGDSDWASTSSGKYNGYSITSTGQLFAWGHNAYGQLGIGIRSLARPPSRSAQTPIGASSPAV